MIYLFRRGGGARHLHHCFICNDLTVETSKFNEHKAKITPRNWSYFFLNTSYYYKLFIVSL